MTKTGQTRIGPQMRAALQYVANHPGCSILPVAQHLHIGARRGTNNACGYNPVHRAIKAGLIYAVRGAGRNGGYALYMAGPAMRADRKP